MEEFQIQDNQLIRYLGHAQNVIIPKGISFIKYRSISRLFRNHFRRRSGGRNALRRRRFYELYQLK